MSEPLFAVEDQGHKTSSWPPKKNSSKAMVIGEVLMGMVSSTSSTAKEVFYPVELTNSGFQTSPRAKDLIRKIRLRSGLTWETLSIVLKVSRRSLHAWANGAEIKSENFAHLEAVYRAISEIDQGDTSANRALLLDTLKGQKPIQLLKDGRFAEVVELIKSAEFIKPGRMRLSPEEMAARAPFSPEILVDANQESVHKPLRSKRMSMKARNS